MGCAKFERVLVAILLLAGLRCAVAQDAGERVDQAALRSKMVALCDQRIEERLTAAGIKPAAGADDAEFCRRVFLDLTGAVPRVSEVKAFLADPRPDKRALLIDRLLESPAHPTHLANTWRRFMLPGGMSLENVNNVVGVQNWLRKRFAENLRYDNFVSELLIATEGSDAGPALYYTSLELAPEKIAGSTARIFLGLQIECAQCHDHPFDQWKQRDFWGYAAFFARLRRPGDNPGQLSLSLTELDEGEVLLPNTSIAVAPKYPGGGAPEAGELGTRRMQLAVWMASRDNPYLAKAVVNRAFRHLFGRGLVEPVDDLSPQNAASHPELFAELTDYFVASGFDLRELLRTLAATRAYQRTSRWTGEPPPPELHARMNLKTLTGEQFYDSLNRILARRSQGSMPGINLRSPLLDPQRQAFLAKIDVQSSSPLDYDAGVLQALTLQNGADLAEATDPARSPFLAALEAPWLDDAARVEILFLATLSRPPSPAERQAGERLLSETSPSEKGRAFGDMLWSLLNSAEFAVNH